MAALAYLIGILSGVAATVQASFNNEIRRSFRSPYTTAAINFVVALTIVAVTLLAAQHSLWIPAAEIAKHPVWIWTGGICGAAIVMTGIVCLPVLGSARNIMLLCFGQIMAGLLIDHYGMFEAPVTKMSLMRVLGAVLEIVGIAFIAIEGGGNDNKEQKSGKVLAFSLIDIAVGFVAAMQVAVNGTLAVVAESPLRATMVSMTGAMITITLVTAGVALIRGKNAIYDEKTPPNRPVRFSALFLSGGLMALIVVGGNAITGPVLGTGMVTMMNLFGMMASSLAVDAAGFLGIERKSVTLRKLAGMALMLIGTGMISF